MARGFLRMRRSMRAAIVTLLLAAGAVALFFLTPLGRLTLEGLAPAYAAAAQLSEPFIMIFVAALLGMILLSVLDWVVGTRWLWATRLLSSLKSLLLVVGTWLALPALLAGLGWAIPHAPTTAFLFALAWTVAGLGLVFVVVVMAASPLIALVSRPKEVDPESTEGKYLGSMVGGLADKAGIRMPRVSLVGGPANAFAIGAFPFQATVAVTVDLMRLVDHDELKAVLAHEVAHLRNGDSVIATVLAYLNTGYLMLLSLGERVERFFSSRGAAGRSSKVLRIVGFAMTGVRWLIQAAAAAVLLMRMAWSRSRELLADHTAVELTGRPEKLATALSKLEAAPAAVMPGSSVANAHQYIVRPMKMWLLGTHPSTKSRVRRIRALEGEHGRWHKLRIVAQAIALPLVIAGVVIAAVAFLAYGAVDLQPAAEQGLATVLRWVG